MPFSHHSHSGQFCPGHARNTLEEMVQTAIAQKMQVFCLTEHMPRHDEDRYPEEVEMGFNMESAFINQASHVEESLRLREKYKSNINLPIGFEIDFCRPQAKDLIDRLLSEHSFDFFMGSLHHVKAIPIDWDVDMYVQAREACGGSDEDIFAAYYEEQYVMLQVTKPLVVGHFDLIRLKSDDPNATSKSMSKVWPLILRNLDFVASYGGILEINSAALRKGMSEPYPKLEICQVSLCPIPLKLLLILAGISPARRKILPF